jgi:hypothetical protein
MVKKFMTLGAFSKGSKPGGDLGGKDVAPIPGEAKIMTVDPASDLGTLQG